MNLFKLSWKYLTFRPLSTGLNVFLLALGLAIITVLLLIQDQFEKKMSQDAAGIDLVVGAKGSPLQLILAGVYHIDFPTGNIPMDEAQKLSRNRLVKNIIPMALGDNYQGFRIVGTNHDYPALYEAELQSGALWIKPFEVVLGAEVAVKSGYKVGDEFLGSHGISVGSHEHDANKFKVVGVLDRKGNVLDRLILTSVESIWYTHDEGETEPADSTANHEEHHMVNLQDSVAVIGFPKTIESRDLTTLLVQYRNPMAAIQLPRLINSGTSMQAASPSFEMSRLFELLGVGITLLQGLAVVIIGISGLGIFIALYNSLKERKYDLAILRAIGASRGQLLLLIFLEGIMLTFMGAVLGILLGHTFLSVIISQNEQGVVGSLQPWIFLKQELWIVVYALTVGVLASIIPAVAAYQTSIAKQLTKA
ncbi:ABC transporter permease [Algoriphagus aquimarinus]|uniref:Putative ABC transport system permease protein n=1 Tax=Algoriphagus aquimarinus TaxID=237018 RepID=A0A1I0YVY9_9BACT|nr:FtsX-like permease family protein [Algoriphagus aquimarinus]SFB16408.1 putative ABC transport system permease protein [Algoriphagus aquimarinus]|tara:strand:- start:543 stop:1805 length:1263 start_codon:yes stop_codon:yes gene_type:complete